MQQTDYDVLIAGGGPAGLACARLLADTGLTVAVVEKTDARTLADPAYDGREIALTHLSRRIMQQADMWDRIDPAAIAPVAAARVSNGDSPYALHFDRGVSGVGSLGFMVSNHLIRRSAWAAVQDCRRVTLLTDAEVCAAGSDRQQAWIRLADGRTLTAALLVAADSRFSAVRRMLGIAASMHDFGRTCIVCRMACESPHAGIAWECFQYDRTLAVLPLNGNCCSVVITLDAQDSAAVLAMPPAEFAHDIARRIDHRLGAMRLVSALFPYPLVAVYAERFHARRCVLVGDAAVGMHPVTAHGFNFGLRGAHTLAQAVGRAHAAGRDFAGAGVLHGYHSAHVRATRPVYLGTNALVRLYTRTDPLARVARRALLVAGNRLPPLRRLITNRLTEVA
ncbi:MAG: 5-demethoxyubiquinol-8 5-hydroxylase UbiM [Pseudomonadota bacterium]